MNRLLFFLIGIYIVFLIYERVSLSYYRSKIKNIIHINGIRGKSTVSRLIDAGLRDEKNKVFTKVTGTEPKIIGTDGVEIPLIRKGKPNIREQIKMLKRAYKEGADTVILECMAVRPQYQRICQHNILKANINVITNVRMDHLDEMGGTLEEIAKSLSNTIPKNGFLFTCEKKFHDFFEKICKKKNSSILLSENFLDTYSKIDFPENVALALDVCSHFNIPKEDALKRMASYKKDMGVTKIIKFKNNNENTVSFINALAANDPESSGKIIDNYLENNSNEKSKNYLMVNNRKDRLSRLDQFLEFVEEHEEKFEKILISGECKELFLKKISKFTDKGRVIHHLSDFDCLDNGSNVFAVGNICGAGKEIIEALEKKEIFYEWRNYCSWNYFKYYFLWI